MMMLVVDPRLRWPVRPAGGSGRKPQKSVQVVYLLCSLAHVDAPTQTLASWGAVTLAHRKRAALGPGRDLR